MKATLKCSVLVGCLAALSAVSADEEGFYERRSEGWFWYEDPQAEKPAEEDKQPPEPDQEQEQESKQDREEQEKEDEPESEDDGPEPYTTKWIRQEIDEARRQAINNPTEKNVTRFLTLQRVAVAKAYEFSDTVREVGQRHPELQPGGGSAQSKVERDTRDQVVEQTRERLMNQLAEDVGIWFFHDGSQYAAAQAKILKRLQRRYDMTVQQVPVQAQPVSGFDTIPNEGLADRLGVTQRIELYAVHKEGGVVPLGDGVQALTDLRSGAIRMASAEGWISREDAIQARRDYGNDPIIERVEQLQQQEQEEAGSDGELDTLMPD